MGMFWRRFNFDARAGLVGGTPIRKVVALGDSQVRIESRMSGASMFLTNSGALLAIQRMTGGRFVFDDTLNLGVSGNTSAQVAARLPSALATDAETLWTESESNDPASLSLDDQWNILLNQIYLPWLAQRPNLLIRAPLRRAAAGYSSLSTADADAIKARKEALRARQIAWGASMGPRVIVVDPAPFFDADGSGTLLADASYFQDGTHVTAKGAVAVGKAGRANSLLISRLAPADFDLSADPGTLLTNGLMAGTGGTYTAAYTNWSGPIPTGWVGSRIRGATADSGTAVSSKQARSDGAPGEWAVLTANAITRAAADASEQYGLIQTLNFADGKYASGDTIELISEMQCLANDGTLFSLQVDIYEDTGSATRTFSCPIADAIFGTQGPIPVDDQPVVVRSPRITLGKHGSTGKVILRVRASFNPRAGSSWQVRFGRTFARKIT